MNASSRSSEKLNRLPQILQPADAFLRIPIYPAMHSDMKPATCTDFKPASVPI
jgi:hypothetical protein